MAALLRKIKKKPIREPSNSLPPVKDKPTKPDMPADVSDEVLNEPNTSSNAIPAAIVNNQASLFSGMTISSNVRKTEDQSSPNSSSANRTTEEPVGEGKETEDSEPQDKGEGGEAPSAFPFISQEPPELPDSEEGGDKTGLGKEDEVSAFSFLQPQAKGEESKEEKSDDSCLQSSEHTDSHPISQSPQQPSINVPLQTQDKDYESSQQTFPTVQNSSGTVSPVPGPISPPMTSHPSTTPSIQLSTPVGKQQPPTNKKKKTRKVVRPGQERVDDPYAALLDISPENSSPKSNSASIGSRTELDSVSLASQASSIEASQDGHSVAITPTEPLDSSVSANEPCDTSDKATVDKEKDIKTEAQDVKREEEGEGAGTLPTSGDDDGKHKETLLVDLSNVEDEGRERERKEESGSEQRLLAEVFNGDLGGEGRKEEKEGDGRKGEGEKVKGGKVTPEGEEVDQKDRETEEKQAENVNYSVELTASEQLSLLIQSSESNLARIRLDLAELHTQKQSHLNQHISAVKQQKENRTQMKELRAREAKALSEEDYELAEELRGELESVSKDSSWSIATASHSLLRQWLQEVCTLIQAEESVQSNIRTQLTEMREIQSQALSRTEDQITSTQTKQKMKLKALEDKMERERGHIALDKEHLQKREQQLQDEIASRAEVFISKKTTLQEELNTVLSDISELEAKLAELRLEEARLQAAIADEETRIEAIHHELDSENCSLHEERDGLTKREQELQAQQEGLNKVRQEYETAQKEVLAEKQSISDVLSRVDMKWVESEHRTHTLVQCLSCAGDLGKMDTSSLLSPSEKLQRCRETVVVREGRVKEVANRVLSLQSLISQLRRQITLTQERVPQLEDAKKAAVAARQYKEAGRVSAELKQLRAEMEQQKKQLEESEAEVSSQNQLLSTLSAELAHEREELEQEERQEDMEHVRQLAAVLAKLQASKASIPVSSSPLGQVIECWLQLYKLLANGLCAKHDLELADFTPHVDLEVEEREGEEVDEKIPADADMMSSMSQQDQIPPEERTPGVGREEEEEEGEGEGEGEGGEGVLSAAEIDEVKRKIAELESKIEEAISEEIENYDLADKLDRELSVLRGKLKSS